MWKGRESGRGTYSLEDLPVLRRWKMLENSFLIQMLLHSKDHY